MSYEPIEVMEKKLYGIREDWRQKVLLESVPVKKITKKTVIVTAGDTLEFYGYRKRIPIEDACFSKDEVKTKFIEGKEDEIALMLKRIEKYRKQIEKVRLL